MTLRFSRASRPSLACAAKFVHLVIGEFRQDRGVLLDREGAATGDLDGVFQGLGEVGEEGAHLGFGLEIVLRGQAAAGLLLVDIGALGDADQRVVGLVHLGLREVDVVGGDQRQAELIGEVDGAAFGQGLDFGKLRRRGRGGAAARRRAGRGRSPRGVPGDRAGLLVLARWRGSDRGGLRGRRSGR